MIQFIVVWLPSYSLANHQLFLYKTVYDPFSRSDVCRTYDPVAAYHFWLYLIEVVLQVFLTLYSSLAVVLSVWSTRKASHAS